MFCTAVAGGLTVRKRGGASLREPARARKIAPRRYRPGGGSRAKCLILKADGIMATQNR